MSELNDYELRKTLFAVENHIVCFMSAYEGKSSKIFDDLRNMQREIAAEMRRRKDLSV